MKKIANILTKGLLVLMDAAFLVVSYVLVIFILKENYMAFILSKRMAFSVGLAVLSFLSILYVLNSYRCIWSYAGIKDFFYTITGCALSAMVVFIITFGMPERMLEFRIQLLSLVFSCALIIGFRAFLKLSYNMIFHRKKGVSSKNINLLIVGAGEGASLIIKEINRSNSDYNIIGAVDDDPMKQGRVISGVNILGNRYDIQEICCEYNVKEILIAIPSISGTNKKDMLEICNRTGCKIKIMPYSMSLLSSPGYKTKMRDVQPEDLLARDVIHLSDEKIDAYINGKVIMVTGGGGSIGSELCRQISKRSPGLLIIFDIYENNAYDLENELRIDYPNLNLKVLIGSVRDRKRLETVFEEYKPEIVFHAAAHKHVPLMEASPGETIKNNICGTMNVCEFADKYAVKRFVLISTDKAVNPTNIMGASKRVCEMIVQAINKKSKTEFVAVRFGNVLGSNGSVIPLFKKQIERGGPITLTHKDITRYFMTIPEAARLVLEAGGYAKGGEIFVLDMGQPVRIYDLAVNLIELSGYQVGKDIEILITGLRPGEKLYEELLMSEEGLSATHNDKIFIAPPGEYNYQKLKENINALINISDSPDLDTIKEEMRRIVPEYKEA